MSGRFRQDIVSFFESKGCLAEPRLVEYLAKRPLPMEEALEALSGLKELPLYLSLEVFREAVERATHPGPLATAVPLLDGIVADPEREVARRKALAEMMQRLDGADGFFEPAPSPGGEANPTHRAGLTDGAPATTSRAPSDHRAPPDGPDRAAHATGYGQARPLPPDGPAVPPSPKDPSWPPVGNPHAPAAPVALLAPLQLAPPAPKMPSETRSGAQAIREDLPLEARLRSGWRPLAAEYGSEIAVLKDVTGNSTCQGALEDFHRYFTSRYDALQRLLRKRREVANAIPIDKLRDRKGQEVQLIGMVNEVATTPNGHRILEVEDRTASIKVLAAKRDEELLLAAGMLVPDEVVGIVGRVSDKGDIVYARQIIRPDAPLNAERRRAEVPLWAAFASDIHVGSKKFMEDRFRKMIDWLAGGSDKSKERDVAGRIKYLVLPGDMVDGVGIYPGQEHELAISDVYEQYGHLARLLEGLPDHVQVIAQPGNHDAARPIEPQPAFDGDVRERFGDIPVTFVSNPCFFSLHGVRVLSYHGCSLMDFATKVQGLDHFKPLPIMKEILRARHIAPIYGGGTPLAPEAQDYMVVDETPEIFATGHVHTTGIDKYRGVTMVNCSCWQSQTDYQRMLNFRPDPCRLPVVDLQRLHATYVNFNDGVA